MIDNQDLLLSNNENIQEGLPPSNFDPKTYKPYFKDLYDSVIVKEWMQEKGYKNIFMVPELEKIVISSSISTLKSGGNQELLKKLFNAIYLLTGVMPVFTYSSVSISQFKLQKGTITGCKAILRRNFLYEFLQRLVWVYLPSVKGFLGIPESSVDTKTLSIGASDIHIFPEVTSYLSLLQAGLTITICIKNSKSTGETIEFLKKFDIPIKKEL